MQIPKRPKQNSRTVADAAYLGRVADRGCCICMRLGHGYTPCQIHHIRTSQGVGSRARDDQAIGLCPNHHQGRDGIHTLGRRAWEKKFEVTELDLLEETQRACA